MLHGDLPQDGVAVVRHHYSTHWVHQHLQKGKKEKRRVIITITEELLTGWPHSSQDKIPCVFPALDNFSLCYFDVINNN